MEILIICLVVIGVMLIGMMFIKKRNNNSQSVKYEKYGVKNHEIAALHNPLSQQQVQFEMLPTTQQIDETKLMNIKDSKVIARVNNLVPGILQASTTASNAIQGGTQVLYQAIIPVGEKLTQSKDIAGAVRGIYHSTEGIRGHANLLAVNNTANVAANATASAMGVASMVVGQYYMTKINKELSKISEGISCIANFQDNEYKSKVFALVNQIKKVSSSQAEILENHELRTVELTNLSSLEQQCIELLGQASLTITGYSKKGNLTFDEYEEALTEVQKWQFYIILF
jgi:hypothetical protein